MITPNSLGVHVLLQKIAAFTKIPKKELVPEHCTYNEEVLPIYRLPAFNDYLANYTRAGDSSPIFYSICAKSGWLNPNDWLNPKRWHSSELRRAFVEACKFDHLRRNVDMSFYVNHAVWMIHLEPKEYVLGLTTGAVYIPDDALGHIVIHPVLNYLATITGHLPPTWENREN